ncbi:carboxypeptidase-like regulatory domain-containing protein [Hymenobacter setariae]|uniref:Carboxypeptidase-like regulatory domain-containing protein n=1 Tax=Hymenobacter setariae TaxID=2594794 RepID=A0A558BPJ9_9BACT|nr:carboxypeptidase-like regulatory domain-containing protein [Hymenobacter setariae]TVT38418.1 carboxypeptidase-like regulatory domain-containing protein [Hymenobacter setariae]
MFTFARPLVALLSIVSLVAGTAQAAGLPGTTTPNTPTESTQLTMLTGTILGADGLPQPGVCVFPIANRRLIAVTDARGTFQLQVPTATTQHLQAEYVGLGSTRFDIDGQHPAPVRIVLGR